MTYKVHGKLEVKKGEKFKIGVKAIDEALDSISELVEKHPYEAERMTFFGNVPTMVWKIKKQLPALKNLSDDDDDNVVKDINSPPFVRVSMSRDNVGSLFGDGWRLTYTNIFKHKGSQYIEYNVSRKYESVTNLLVMLRVCGFDVNEQLKSVLFSGLNNKFETKAGKIELAGVDNIVNDCLQTVTSDDERLVSRHVLLAGPPGCGKSEIVKKIVKETPDWVHYTLSNDISDWGAFMLSLNKIMEFIGRRVMIIVDEIDEIGLSRDKNSRRVYDLLRVMDGVTDMGRIKFVATTNRPAVLDPALKRIGRFGPVHVMDAPNTETFLKIVEFYNERYGGKVDAKKLLSVRKDAVGAEVRASFEDCIIHNLEITTKNVIANLKKIQRAKEVEMQDFV